VAAADAERRRTVARIAALTRWSREDPHDAAVRGQAGLRAKFLSEVVAEGTVPASGQQAAAERRYKAHMSRLALRSAEARRKPTGRG
jgi:hypothetical protein